MASDSGIVDIICYGTTKQMTRGEAKERYLGFMANCEGAERDRYTNVYLKLMAGERVCSDQEED